MPLLRSFASGLLGRKAARRLSRAIPNPMLRWVAATAATAIVTIVIERVVSSRRSRRGKRAR